MELQVCCLGRLSLRCREAPELAARELPLPATLKAQSLLAYLVVHRDHSTPAITWLSSSGVIGPSTMPAAPSPPRCGRSAAACQAMTSSSPMSAAVQFNPRSPFWLDAAEFEDSWPALATLARAAQSRPCEQAVALYRGAFLDGFYDDWVLSERYRLESLYCEALVKLMAAREALGEHAARACRGAAAVGARSAAGGCAPGRHARLLPAGPTPRGPGPVCALPADPGGGAGGAADGRNPGVAPGNRRRPVGMRA